jgi:hypothetical protein
MLKLRHCSIPFWQAARLANGIRRELRGRDSPAEITRERLEPRKPLGYAFLYHES